MVVRTDHSPLRHLPNQNSVNTRVWKWLAIMQGYNLDIQHIPGKVNPADHLSRQSLNQAIEQKGKVNAENDKFVQRMRIPEDATDDDIQKILTETISKISVQVQYQAQFDQDRLVSKIRQRQRQ